MLCPKSDIKSDIQKWCSKVMPKVSSKGDVQKLHAKVSFKSYIQKWRQKVTLKSDVQKWRQKVMSQMFYKSDLQKGCPRGMFSKSDVTN